MITIDDPSSASNFAQVSADLAAIGSSVDDFDPISATVDYLRKDPVTVGDSLPVMVRDGGGNLAYEDWANTKPLPTIEDLLDCFLASERGILANAVAEAGLPSGDWASGYQDFTNTIAASNCTVQRAAAGLYDVAFIQPHPSGAAYAVIASGEEDQNNRDCAKVTVVRGTRTENGFRLMITVDDNGTTADTLIDDEFSFVVKR